MKNIEQYPILQIKPKKYPVLNASENSTIIAYDEMSALKIPVSPEYDIVKEFKLQEELLEEGFPVAQPMGIFRLLHTGESVEKARDLGLLMQKIKGTTIQKLPATHIFNAIGQYEGWLNTAHLHGYSVPTETHDKCLFSKAEKKLYIFGFDNWEKHAN